MTVVSLAHIQAAMQTPLKQRRQLKNGKPSSMRRRWSPPEGCYTGLQLLRDAVLGPQREPALDRKLEALAKKLDLITKQMRLDNTDSLKDMEDAGKDFGIEVGRYSQIPQLDASILDTYIPQCRRLTQLHFGQIVSNPHAPMAFKEKMGYNMTYNLVPPGHGNALHMHRSFEFFVALDGRWEIAWGMQGENTVVLEPWDFVAVPARVCHSYRNIEEKTAQNIMTILPGRSSITWAPNVVAEARSNGADCDGNGILRQYAQLMSNTKGLDSAPESVQWKEMGPEEMLPYVHKFSEKKPFECKIMDEEAGGGPASHIEMFWKIVQPNRSINLPRKDGVDLLLVVLDGTVLVKLAGGRTLAAAGRLDAVKVPCEALEAGEVTISNLCPSACTLLVTATHMRSHNELYFHLC